MRENDFSFISESVEIDDFDLFLGPIDTNQERVFIFHNEENLLAHIMHKAGIFPSVSQARKNGWNKEIPLGFSEFTVGKKKILISIFNVEGEGMMCFPENEHREIGK